jgi:hypothetical protein
MFSKPQVENKNRKLLKYNEAIARFIDQIMVIGDGQNASRIYSN